MTARRRRKSGSGPSATALIAWVGGQALPGASAGTALHAWSTGRMLGGRAIFAGRAFGLAAGTALVCGSVLASAIQAGDGSLTGRVAPLPSHTPAELGAVPGTPDGYDGYGETVSAGRAPAAPVVVSAQAFARPSPASAPQPAPVHRNSPMAMDVSAERGTHPDTAKPPWRSPASPADEAPTSPIAPVSPVLDPAAAEVGRVAPVGVLEPSARSDARRGPSSSRAVKAVAPATRALVEKMTQPAMAMLAGLLPRA